MTDKELLELAAKAAGIHLDGYGYNPDVAMEGFRNFDTGDTWNPLEDDGDALRLAVTIAGNGWCFADLDAAYYEDKIPCWLDANDPYAATRRAIVRAAAEIGKEIK